MTEWRIGRQRELEIQPDFTCGNILARELQRRERSIGRLDLETAIEIFFDLRIDALGGFQIDALRALGGQGGFEVDTSKL